MKTIRVKNILGFVTNKITFYDGSIKELPAWRFHELNKLFLQDAQIGCDFTSVSTHYAKIAEYVKHGEKQAALQELQNLHNNLYYTITGISLKSYCMMAMVYSINDEQITDFSPEAMKGHTKRLAKTGIKQSQVEDIVNEVKKNFFQSLDASFLIDMENQRLLNTLNS